MEGRRCHYRMAVWFTKIYCNFQFALLTKAILLVLKDSDSQTYTLETNETISYHVCHLIIEIIVFAYKSSLKVVNDTFNNIST
jgi:hypothetical protein